MFNSRYLYKYRLNQERPRQKSFERYFSLTRHTKRTQIRLVFPLIVIVMGIPFQKYLLGLVLSTIVICHILSNILSFHSRTVYFFLFIRSLLVFLNQVLMSFFDLVRFGHKRNPCLPLATKIFQSQHTHTLSLRSIVFSTVPFSHQSLSLLDTERI